ncbi:hypothetical protein L3X38_017633 [Prunus dulcis]|uniref:Uncharacterized protein n=1 Tax=Prunus dulcis TaxID=3755 RepID=A0AAD4Z9C1_PRUDU|nr:hypothetical protein L3X38_017633 [Prunus dulcis]
MGLVIEGVRLHPAESFRDRLPNTNFGVPMESEASELPKGVVLDGGGHVHIRHITPSPLINVGYYNPPLLGTRRSRRHTRTTQQIDSDTKLSHPEIGSAVARYCPLSAPYLSSQFYFWELTSNFSVGHPSWYCSNPNLLNFRVPMESEARWRWTCTYKAHHPLSVGRCGMLQSRFTSA